MIPFEHHSTKFTSHRNLVLAKNGMVATGSTLASSAGSGNFAYGRKCCRCGDRNGCGIDCG
jgi:hypothetical protein